MSRPLRLLLSNSPQQVKKVHSAIQPSFLFVVHRSALPYLSDSRANGPVRHGYSVAHFVRIRLHNRFSVKIAPGRLLRICHYEVPLCMNLKMLESGADNLDVTTGKLKPEQRTFSDSRHSFRYIASHVQQGTVSAQISFENCFAGPHRARTLGNAPSCLSQSTESLDRASGFAVQSISVLCNAK